MDRVEEWSWRGGEGRTEGMECKETRAARKGIGNKEWGGPDRRIKKNAGRRRLSVIQTPLRQGELQHAKAEQVQARLTVAEGSALWSQLKSILDAARRATDCLVGDDRRRNVNTKVGIQL